VPEPDDFMTVAEVASILKLNQQTVRNWIDQGKAPGAARRPAGPHPSRRLDQLLEASVIGRPQPAGSSIWDGEIPSPQVPADQS
jgi:hypothetical protein